VFQLVCEDRVNAPKYRRKFQKRSERVELHVLQSYFVAQKRFQIKPALFLSQSVFYEY